MRVVKYKTRLLKILQTTYSPTGKYDYNKATTVLKQKIEFKNDIFSKFIADLNDYKNDHVIMVEKAETFSPNIGAPHINICLTFVKTVLYTFKYSNITIIS